MNKSKNLKKTNTNIIVSFGLSFFLVFLVFIINQMLFGDYMLLRSDLLEGIALYKGASRDILNGNNPFFTYNIGMGINNSLSLAFSYFSPFNLLYILFYNIDDSLVTAIIIALKIGFTSSFFYIFSSKYLSKKNIICIIFSVFYSMCAFSIAYGTIHIYWLDAVMATPLLIYSILNCIYSSRRVLMIITYTYLFVSCFYMGYIVGVFSLIFILLYMLLIYECNGVSRKKEIIKIIFNWFAGVIIAIILSCVVWCPTLFFLLANRAEDSTQAVTLITPISYIINSLFWGNSSGISGVYSYIYCGTPILLLVPLYFLNKNIKNKEKIFCGILLSFYFACMIIVPLNQIMHAMDQPDYFWYRFSFIISFILCSISVRQLDNIENNSKKSLPFIILALWMTFYIIVQQSISLWQIPDGEFSLNSNYGLLINFILMTFWIIIGITYLRQDRRTISYASCILLIIIEITTNSVHFFPYKEEKIPYSNLSLYMNMNVNEINRNDEGLFRTIVNNSKDFSNGYYYGYNDFSYFGSQEKYEVRKFLSNIGFTTSTRMVVNNGHNPVSDMLLGVKYYIDCPNELYESKSILSFDQSTYYINDYYLSYGYLVPGDTIFYEPKGRNVFENINSLTNALSGEDYDCFKMVSEEDIYYDFDSVELSKTVNGLVFNKTSDEGSVLISVPIDKYSEVYIQFEEEVPIYKGTDFEVVFADNHSNNDMNGASVSCSNKMSVDENTGYNYISLYSGPDQSETFECDSINTYYVDYEALKKQYDVLSKNQLNISNWKNGHIEGNINVDGNKRLMLLTVPYDPGWKAFVNGNEVEIARLLDGAFMGVFFPKEGDYEVVFDYEVPGLKIGMIVSLCGLLALLSVIFEKKLKKQKI